MAAKECDLLFLSACARTRTRTRMTIVPRMCLVRIAARIRRFRGSPETKRRVLVRVALLLLLFIDENAKENVTM